MTMKLNQHLCFVFIVYWSNVIDGKAIGQVDTQHSPLLLKTNGNIAELYNSVSNGGSWLQAMLLFARHDQSGVNETSKFASVLNHEATMTCPNEFVTLGEHCYYFGPKATNWHEARKACLSQGTDLAYPMNSVENALLVNYLRYHHKGSGGWWFGGTDETKEGEFLWAHSKSRIVYADWSSGQPDNAGKNENCLDYVEGFDWKWNDRPCTVANRYICQQ